MTPFAAHEVGAGNLDTLWLRGGFPHSFLASSIENSAAWRATFICTFLERDIAALGVSDTTASRYLDILTGTLMLRRICSSTRS